MGISNIIFFSVFIVSNYFFIRNLKRIISSIKLGRDINRSDRKSDRWKNMFRVALGQSKMTRRPVAGILHIILYLGFIIINIEIIEIIVDGVFGTHRFLSYIIPVELYNFLIGSFEILAFLVFVACLIYLARRNLLKIKRFWSKEMTKWPRTDANLILVFEILLMGAFLLMNASDALLNSRGDTYYVVTFSNPISQFLIPLIETFSNETLVIIERFTWWFHIVGILAFLNYVLISKHLHILLAFPNTYFSNLDVIGKVNNLSSVYKEVKAMMDPNNDPFANTETNNPVDKFGASDVFDLNWFQLLNAYTCTECGRCSSECPANETGKLLSPRTIMMKTRDRVEEVGKNIDKNGKFIDDNKTLLNDYISKEELWACTTCNACVEACPIGIDPLSIILDMRRYLVMEQSSAPSELNNMMSNLENNGAPWPFNQQDRLNWKN